MRETIFDIRRFSTHDGEEIADACPSGALVMDAEVYETEELVSELLKDQIFFRRGGSSIS